MNAAVTLTRAARPATFEVDAVDESGMVVATSIAGEHPLTLYLDKRELVTLMTLGAAPEHLTLGYLRNQRLVDSPRALASVQVDWASGAVAVTSRLLADTGMTLWESPEHGAALLERMEHRTVTTGCGQGTMFGEFMSTLSRRDVSDEARLHEDTLYAVMDRVRRHESIYKQAGAVHGCALCSNAPEDRGEILQFVEDVGRHNAVDAIAGWMWLQGATGRNKIFYTTGRLTSEMVIKCAQMEISFLVSRSGLTKMGYDLARELGITMIGRCQGKHYLLFTGAQRFDRALRSAQ